MFGDFGKNVAKRAHVDKIKDQMAERIEECSETEPPPPGEKPAGPAARPDKIVQRTDCHRRNHEPHGKFAGWMEHVHRIVANLVRNAARAIKDQPGRTSQGEVVARLFRDTESGYQPDLGWPALAIAVCLTGLWLALVRPARRSAGTASPGS